MGFFDYILLAVVGLCAFFSVRYMIRRKKDGKCAGCDCCGNHCPEYETSGGQRSGSLCRRP